MYPLFTPCSSHVPPAEEDHDHHLLRHPGRGPGVDHRGHAGLLDAGAAAVTTTADRPSDRQQREETPTTTQKLENTNARQKTNQLEEIMIQSQIRGNTAGLGGVQKTKMKKTRKNGITS